MRKQSKLAVIGRVVGAGPLLGGVAVGAVLLSGTQAHHETDNALLGDSVWVNTQGVNTVGTVGVTSLDILPGETVGNTVVTSPGPSIASTDGSGPGNTIVWFPGGAVVTVGSTFLF